MASPTAGAVHVDSALTNISIAFLQNANNFVASSVFPNVPVDKQSDRYFTFDRGDFNRDEAQIRAPGTESAGGGYTLDNTPTYFANVYAFHKDIPDQIVANADQAVDLERAAAEFVSHKLLIKKERDFVTNYMSPSVWTNDYDGVSSSSPSANQATHWSDATNGTPIENIRSAKSTILQSTGFMPNTLVMGQQVMDALVDHPDIVDRVKYSGGVGNGNPAMVNEQTLAALFGVERVLVSRAIYNTADEGASNSHSFITGKDCLLTYSAPTPSLMAPSAGYTFSWTGYLGGGNSFGMATKRMRMDHLESERVEGAIAMDMKLVSADLGFFWDGIVA
jgi:hypothetical protein